MVFRTLPLAVLALAALAGCNSTFTNIQRLPDNTYYLTQVKQGPFFIAGSAWRCVPTSETTMRCARVAVPP